MSGRFMTKFDLQQARLTEEIFNSRIKRKELDTSNIVRTAYVVCGCGTKGCGFITHWYREDKPNS